MRDSESDAQFRKEVRSWLSEAVPRLGAAPAERDWAAKKLHDSRWQRKLYDAGYAGIDWPREFGGRGATPSEHLIFLEESAAAGGARGERAVRRPAPRRPDADRRGDTRAAGIPPSQDPHRRDRLVSGLLRTRLRQRPRELAHQGGPRRRPLRRVRAEDLDVVRPAGPTTASCWYAPTRTPRSTAESPG